MSVFYFASVPLCVCDMLTINVITQTIDHKDLIMILLSHLYRSLMMMKRIMHNNT